MLARVARYEVETQRIDDAVQAFGEAAGQIEELQGFAGGFVTFPAGTFSGFFGLVVTPGGSSGTSPVAHVANEIVNGDGSITALITLSSTAGSFTPIDGSFLFIASAPLSTATSGVRTSTAQRKIFGKRIARSDARVRKGH